MPLRDWVPAIGLRRYSSMYVCLCCMLTTCSTCCPFTYSYCPLVNLTELNCVYHLLVDDMVVWFVARAIVYWR